MHGKKAIIKSLVVISSKIDTPPLIGFLYFREKVYNVVRLAEVVLYIVVLGWDSKFYKLILERPGLLKKAMRHSFYFHIIQI